MTNHSPYWYLTIFSGSIILLGVYLAFIGYSPLNTNHDIATIPNSIIPLYNLGLLLALLGLFTTAAIFLSRLLRVDPHANTVYILTFNIFVIIYSLNFYLCDDAFITFRVVDNFVHGYGLRWNVGERVQAFTNPLWLFSISPLYWLGTKLFPGHNLSVVYWSSFFLSLLYGFVTIILLVKKHVMYARFLVTIFLFLLLMTSKAFIDFTSSGLENPLSYFLIAIFYYQYFRFPDNPSKQKLYFICIVASLAYCNRQDLALYLILPIFHMLYISKNTFGLNKASKIVLIGTFPAACWTIFSLIYYGFPFPNTYFAKMELGYTDIVVKQSINYIYAVLVTDPITVAAILSTLFMSMFSHINTFRIAGLSIALYLCYILTTGGDFMGGRYVSTTYLLSVIIISEYIHTKYKVRIDIEKSNSYSDITAPTNRYDKHGPIYIALTFALLIYNTMIPLSPFKSGSYVYLIASEKNQDSPPFSLARSHKNIYHDKLYYYPPSNVLLYSSGGFPFQGIPFHLLPDAKTCKAWRNESYSLILVDGGLHAFCRGPKPYVLSNYSLTDALIARLPTPDLSNGFAPGHIVKAIPEGLKESVLSQSNRIRDKKLAKYYDKIRLVTTGNLFTWNRLLAIYDLNIRERKYRLKYY